MAIKYLDDYVDELAEFFPQIEKKELKRMVNGMSDDIIKYMRRGHKGISVGSKDYLGKLEGENKRPVFYLQRIFSRHHKEITRLGIITRNKQRDELYGKE